MLDGAGPRSPARAEPERSARSSALDGARLRPPRQREPPATTTRKEKTTANLTDQRRGGSERGVAARVTTTRVPAVVAWGQWTLRWCRVDYSSSDGRGQSSLRNKMCGGGDSGCRMHHDCRGSCSGGTGVGMRMTMGLLVPFVNFYPNNRCDGR